MENEKKSFLKRKVGPFAVQFWLVLIVLAGGVLFGLERMGIIGFTPKESQYVKVEESQRVTLQTAPANYKESVPPLDQVVFPENERTSIPGAMWTLATIPWQGASPVIYANGGSYTKKNSLLEKAGVRLNIQRKDMYSDHYDMFNAFAQAFNSDPNSTQGAQFTIFMGDAAAYYIQAMNDKVKAINPDFKAEVFYISGGSFGEDGYFGPPGFYDQPNNARGSVCACVRMDGDQNIVLLWAAENNIPINPDPNTYDPDAINFMYTDDFIAAVDLFITGAKINRPEVKAGKKTGNMVEKAVNSFATWTPGDVYLYEKYKGNQPIVRVMSTHENRNQMLTTIVGLNKHLEANRDKIAKMLLAFDEAANLIKTYDEVLLKACEFEVEVFEGGEGGDKSHNGEWWARYFKGDTVLFNGQKLALGGSMVKNLSEAADAFGVGIPEATGYYKTVYKTFGDMYVKLYPEDLKSYPPASEAFNGAYIEAAINLKKQSGKKLAGETEMTYKTGESEKVVTQREWAIEFASGQASLTQKGRETLDEVYGQLVVSQGLRIRLQGFTDTDGDDASNMTLSQNRANAVKAYLSNKGGKNFGDERFENVKGMGESSKYDNSTNAGKSKNRRVEISLVK